MTTHENAGEVTGSRQSFLKDSLSRQLFDPLDTVFQAFDPAKRHLGEPDPHRLVDVVMDGAEAMFVIYGTKATGTLKVNSATTEIAATVTNEATGATANVVVDFRAVLIAANKLRPPQPAVNTFDKDVDRPARRAATAPPLAIVR